MPDPTPGWLLDEVLPHYDVGICRHIVVCSDPGATWQSARELDLLTVHSPILDAAMWVRGLPARATGRAVPVPPRLVIADGGLPGWMVLAEGPTEIVFGAVGRFWTPVISWRDDVGPAEFTDFAQPGWGKIAANFTVLPYGPRSLVTYECRTTTTDPRSSRAFGRYWWLIRPFVAHIMTTTLATIKANAEAD